MTAPLLADALGPRARRRVAVASIVSAAVLVLLGIVAGRRLAATGQLDAERWTPLLQVGTVRFLLGGLANTVRAALTAMAAAVAVGALLALVRLSRSRLGALAATAYVEFFRATPLVLLMLFLFLAAPRLGIGLTPFWAVVLGLTIYNAAVLCEILRAGVLSLDRGQVDAAAAVGLTRRQSMRFVILPQAVRRMLPAVVSQLVTLLKDSALGLVVSYEELLTRARQVGTFSGNPLQAYFTVALVYIVVNLALSSVAHHLEVRQRRRYRAGPIAPAGAEELAVLAGAEART